ncbi:hypothetical protein [Streptomyces sp. NPDC055287]
MPLIAVTAGRQLHLDDVADVHREVCEHLRGAADVTFVVRKEQHVAPKLSHAAIPGPTGLGNLAGTEAAGLGPNFTIPWPARLNPGVEDAPAQPPGDGGPSPCLVGARAGCVR